MKKLNARMTQEQQQCLQQRLVELVNEGKSGHQIANELRVNYTTVHRWLRKLGLNLPNYHNELKFDNTIFDSIDTEEKAYWLGFLYADGYISTERDAVELSLMGSDVEHLEKFRTFLGYKNPVRMGVVKCNKKEFSRCRLHLVNKHFRDTLIQLGCLPKKSLKLNFPNESVFASKELIRHFIRGYFDGDGSITHTKDNRLEVIIVGTKEMLDGIMRYCPNCFASNRHKDKRHPLSNTFMLVNTCNKATTFCHLIYDNATIYLQRKYDKFNELRNDKR